MTITRFRLKGITLCRCDKRERNHHVVSFPSFLCSLHMLFIFWTSSLFSTLHTDHSAQLACNFGSARCSTRGVACIYGHGLANGRYFSYKQPHRGIPVLFSFFLIQTNSVSLKAYNFRSTRLCPKDKCWPGLYFCRNPAFS